MDVRNVIRGMVLFSAFVLPFPSWRPLFLFFSLQVALNNKILTDAMSSGLLEQSKPAWNFNRLDALWNDLRDEFSIGERYVGARTSVAKSLCFDAKASQVEYGFFVTRVLPSLPAGLAKSNTKSRTCKATRSFSWRSSITRKATNWNGSSLC